jgi:protein tyrosine phosphatase
LLVFNLTILSTLGTRTLAIVPIFDRFSAGIGRTGTFIGLHELMKYARTKGSLDIFQYAKKMRDGDYICFEPRKHAEMDVFIIIETTMR